MEEKKYEEFNDVKLAKLYDIANGLDKDEIFWLEQIAKINPKRVVDFGCWTWLLTCKIAEKWHDVIWIDPAKPMIELALGKPFADKIDWRIGSTDKLVWEQTDLIIMTSHVIQFFTDASAWKKLLSQSYDSLSEWGYILFDSKNAKLEPWRKWTKKDSLHTVETLDDSVEIWTELLELWEDTTVHKHHYSFQKLWEELTASTALIYRTENEIRKDLESAWFTVEKVYWDFYWKDYDEDSSKEIIFLAKKV